ncbi:MAG TPA: XdhC family protein [Acidimicrobiales bacterium]|nr:XdhC family protein [Acidimicrobiales bacterium]
MTVLEQAAARQQRGEPFVIVTVVWRRGPTSGRQGSKVLILPDGTMRGWLGGACAEPAVVGQALAALGDGRPRLLLLGPLDEVERGRREGVLTVPIACASEGAMEVYVEPVLPAPQVVAIGRTPAVDILVEMALTLGWRAAIVELDGAAGLPTHVDNRSAVVVATQGRDDERWLQAALKTEAGYVGLVASHQRAQAVLDYLRARGVTESDLARIRAPAGLDLGSTTNEEIGVAILAELVALRAAGQFATGPVPSAGVEVTDPVCGMAIDPARASYCSEHGGRVWYFCGPECQRQFERDPERYVEPDSVSSVQSHARSTRSSSDSGGGLPASK